MTRTRAEVLNTGDDIGTLESGKFADIVACDGNPAIETRATAWNRFVMQSGRVVRFDAKD
ncbi:MAG: amidohydrolase family protein [Chloroflexi bacterium]|nr:amidohydrolase family protein [Chloroflexota bacterium]